MSRGKLLWCWLHIFGFYSSRKFPEQLITITCSKHLCVMCYRLDPNIFHTLPPPPPKGQYTYMFGRSTASRQRTRFVCLRAIQNTVFCWGWLDCVLWKLETKHHGTDCPSSCDVKTVQNPDWWMFHYYLLYIHLAVMNPVCCRIYGQFSEADYPALHWPHKSKSAPLHTTEALCVCVRKYRSCSFLTSALDGCKWSVSCPGCTLSPWKGPLVPKGHNAV
jgi:hypothetical protein